MDVQTKQTVLDLLNSKPKLKKGQSIVVINVPGAALDKRRWHVYLKHRKNGLAHEEAMLQIAIEDGHGKTQPWMVIQ